MFGQDFWQPLFTARTKYWSSFSCFTTAELWCTCTVWLVCDWQLATKHSDIFFFYSFTFNQIAWGHLNLYTSLIFLNKLSATLTLHTDNQGHDTQLIRGLWKQRDCPPLTVISSNENIDHMVESGCAVMVTHFNKMN